MADPELAAYRQTVVDLLTTGVGILTLVGALVVFLLAVMVVRHL